VVKKIISQSDDEIDELHDTTFVPTLTPHQGSFHVKNISLIINYTIINI
jgi:hypothetical protein